MTCTYVRQGLPRQSWPLPAATETPSKTLVRLVAAGGCPARTSHPGSGAKAPEGQAHRSEVDGEPVPFRPARPAGGGPGPRRDPQFHRGGRGRSKGRNPRCRFRRGGHRGGGNRRSAGAVRASPEIVEQVVLQAARAGARAGGGGYDSILSAAEQSSSARV